MKAAGVATYSLVVLGDERLNRHRFMSIEAQSIRLHVHATNGDRLVRVFEVRCYG
jgi:hypothetical protein